LIAEFYLVDRGLSIPIIRRLDLIPIVSIIRRYAAFVFFKKRIKKHQHVGRIRFMTAVWVVSPRCGGLRAYGNRDSIFGTLVRLWLKAPDDTREKSTSAKESPQKPFCGPPEALLRAPRSPHKKPPRTSHLGGRHTTPPPLDQLI
jgi:hypothetical protein